MKSKVTSGLSGGLGVLTRYIQKPIEEHMKAVEAARERHRNQKECQ